MRLLLGVLCYSILAASAAAFSVSTTTPFGGARIIHRTAAPLFSEPSDTSSDPDDYVLTITSEDVESTPGEALVSSVMDLMPNTLLGDVSTETRTQINEALYKLEALNPTKQPITMSPLLNGVWELRYVGGYAPEWTLPSPTRQLALFLYSGGYSPGIFALGLAQKLPFVEVGELEIAISRQQPRVQATVGIKLFGTSGSESKVSVTARLEVESDVRLRETYETATVLGRVVDIPQQLQYARDLYVTYVDNDLLVVRDGSGVPEVLVRKEKTFSQNWGTDPPGEDE